MSLELTDSSVIVADMPLPSSFDIKIQLSPQHQLVFKPLDEIRKTSSTPIPAGGIASVWIRGVF